MIQRKRLKDQSGEDWTDYIDQKKELQESLPPSQVSIEWSDSDSETIAPNKSNRTTQDLCDKNASMSPIIKSRIRNHKIAKLSEIEDNTIIVNLDQQFQSPPKLQDSSQLCRVKRNIFSEDSNSIVLPKKSRNLSLFRNAQYEEISTSSNYKQPMTGSTWLGSIRNLTPEKAHPSNRKTTEQPGSTKKKCVKNGFADKLTKLVFSWHSDKNMWDHQLSTLGVTTNEEKSPLLPKKKSVLPSSGDPCNSQDIQSPGSSVNSFHANLKNSKYISFKVLSRSKEMHQSSKALLVELCDSNIEISSSGSQGAEFFEVTSKTPELKGSQKPFKTYLLYLGLCEDTEHLIATPDDIVTVYAPWEVLKLETENICAIFSSFYIIQKPTEHDALMVPHKVEDNPVRKLSPVLRRKVLSQKFLCVENSPKQKDNMEIVSLMKAMETHVPADSNLRVTIKILRFISARDPGILNVTHYLLIGQDPDGIYVVVNLPNDVLMDGQFDICEKAVGTTHTISGLVNPERWTDSEDKPLFSLLWSLHKAYIKSIQDNDVFSTLFAHHLKQNRPTFCYKFMTDPKKFSTQLVANEGGPSTSLPQWNLDDICHVRCNERGSIRVCIYYFVKSCFYVTPRDHPRGILWRVRVTDDCLLPNWTNEYGTIMANVVMKHILVRNGKLIADKYTVIQRINQTVKPKFKDLIHMIPTYLPQYCKQDDIVTVSGAITKVYEETAMKWEECDDCGTEIYLVLNEIRKCQCTNTPSEYTIKYQLEVDIAYNSTTIKIKLFQKTISNIMTSFSDDEVSTDEVIGFKIGPLICIIDEESTDQKIFTELPY